MKSNAQQNRKRQKDIEAIEEPIIRQLARNAHHYAQEAAEAAYGNPLAKHHMRAAWRYFERTLTAKSIGRAKTYASLAKRAARKAGTSS